MSVTTHELSELLSLSPKPYPSNANSAIIIAFEENPSRFLAMIRLLMQYENYKIDLAASLSPC
jgi:hypothetical protein